MFKTRVGTPSYVAPEVLISDSYGFECDIWSIGVILYVIVSGYMPFGGLTTKERISNVKKAQFNYSAPTFSNISWDCKHFINQMIKFYPQNRLTIPNALKEKWLASNISKIAEVRVKPEIFHRIMSYEAVPVIKKAALRVLVKYLDDKTTQDLRKQFLALDLDRSGLVYPQEI